MVRVAFASAILKHASAASTAVEAESVRTALDAVFSVFPGVRGYVLDDQGSIRQHVTVFVNNRTISDRIALTDRLTNGDEVFVFQALSGG